MPLLAEYAYAEFQFRLDVEPLLKWDSLVPKVRKYLDNAGDSIDLVPIIGRYSASVREFYKWFWLQIDEKVKPEREDYDAHTAELVVFGEEVFLAPELDPKGWRGAARRLGSCALAASFVGRDQAEALGTRAQVIPWYRRRQRRRR